MEETKETDHVAANDAAPPSPPGRGGTLEEAGISANRITISEDISNIQMRHSDSTDTDAIASDQQRSGDTITASQAEWLSNASPSVQELHNRIRQRVNQAESVMLSELDPQLTDHKRYRCWHVTVVLA